MSFAGSRIRDHFEGSPWRRSLQDGLAPLVVGLMATGVISIAHSAIKGAAMSAIAATAFLGVALLRKVNPSLFIFAGGLIGLTPPR